MQVLRIGLLDRLVVMHAPDDGDERIRDGNGRDDDGRDHDHERGRADDAQKRDDAEHGAEEQRSRIPHEDARGIEVVTQEPEAGAQEHDGEHGDFEAELAHADEEERERSDADDACGQAVEAVHEIDDVHERHQVEHRQRIRKPTEFDIARPERVVDRRKQDPGRGDDGSADDLAEQLRRGFEGLHVVDGADEHRDRETDEHALVIDRKHPGRALETMPVQQMLGEDFEYERPDHADEHGDAAHARDGNRVDAARAWIVDRVQAEREPLDDGNHQQRHREGDDAQHQKVPDICADNHLVAFLVEFDGGLDVALEDVAALLKHDAALAEFLCRAG